MTTKRCGFSWGFRGLPGVGALLLALALRAGAVDDVPDIKALIHPAIPKDGTRASAPGQYEGDLRNTFDTTVETFWKEISYHEADPVTGEKTHGFYMDTKTLGYVDLPWACNPTRTNAVRADSYVCAFDDKVLPNNKPGRPVNFGGEHNFETGRPQGKGDDGQLYGGSGPLVDQHWTPGERFQDVDGNGKYTYASNLVVKGEDWWDSDNTNALPREWPGPREISRYNGANGAPPDTRGELYADYDGGTLTNLINGVMRVTRVDFDASVAVFMVNGQSNSAVTLTELDLTPNNNLTAVTQPSEEGDFFHKHIPDPVTGNPTNDIARNHTFDYQVDLFGDPLVFPARSGTDTNLVLTLSYKRWMLINTNNGSQSVYSGTQAQADGAVQVDVTVPVFQSYELWGTAEGSVFSGTNVVWSQGISTNKPGEPFEDFISWWVPPAGPLTPGFWVGGVAGGPVTNANMPLKTDRNQIGWIAYQDYIRNNYPGNVDALIARAGNGQYDGPDNWLEKIANKMQITGIYDGGETVTGPPAPAPFGFWDPRGWYGGSWESWWTAIFHSEPPSWDANIPICTPFAPAAFVPIAGKEGGWIPTAGSTWGYDGPREFQDLPSSLYHIGNGASRGAYRENPYPGGGDLRLGEVTSPFNESIFGEDIGDNDPTKPLQKPDFSIAPGGPLAFNGFAMYGYDARNVLNLELMTWRTDGNSLTGPTNPEESSGNSLAPILYGGDHRDLNLDGLVDQGETVPAGSHCYFVDDNMAPDSIDGGFTTTCMYPFNWDRYAEDCIAANDNAENYAQSSSYGTLPIDDPLGRSPARGAAGPILSNVLAIAVGVPHNAFAPSDSVWLETLRDGLYNTDTPLNEPPPLFDIPSGQPGTPLSAAFYQSINQITGFDIDHDNAWADTAPTNGIFDCEMVLEQMSTLVKGTIGVPFSVTHPGSRIVYLPNSGTDFQYGDGIWREDPLPGDTNAVAMQFDSTDTQILPWSFLPIGTLATHELTNVVDSSGNLWVDANGNRAFDAEEILRSNTLFVDANGNPAFYPGTVGAALTNVLYFDRGGAGYQKATDDAWLSLYGQSAFFREPMLNGRPPNNGTPSSYAIFNARYVDGDSSGAYTPATPTNLADAAWVDANSDGLFAANGSRRLPTYFIGAHNGIGIGLDLAGNGYDCYTRDADFPLSGGIQVVPTSLGPLHHEMGHDMHGWPDLYDYDTYLANGIENSPIAGFDLMARGGLEHGIPDLKLGWALPVNLATLLPKGGGVQSVFIYPCERNRDQYYYFGNVAKGGEYYWFWYQSGVAANPFKNFAGPGGRGLHIEHRDGGSLGSVPLQQRHNNHYALEMVQADGLYEMQDAVNGGGEDDVWPGTTGNRVFSAFSIPQARWWDQTDTGLRIHDVILSEDPLGPVEVRFEYYDPSLPWAWPSSGADVDGDSIPDVWEYHYFGGIDTATHTTDWDRDGLSDYGEYLADTNPRAPGSNDGVADKDGDGISNADEVNLYATDPRLPDTDDDGIADGIEQRWQAEAGADPTNSLLPARGLAVDLGGTTNDFITLPTDLRDLRFSLTSWTVEANILTDAAWSNASALIRYRLSPSFTNRVLGSVLVERRVGIGQDTFVLGVDRAGHPTAGFGGSDVSWVTAVNIDEGVTSVPNDGITWTWLSATYDAGTQMLRLFVNGTERAALPTSGRSPTLSGPGPFMQRLGTGFNGAIDEIRIWDRALPRAQILQYQTGTPPDGTEANLVALYKFDDTTSFSAPDSGTSAFDAWSTGQVEDFLAAYPQDWRAGWPHGATLAGNSRFVPLSSGVLFVSSPNPDGVYGPGSDLDVQVRFSDVVTVTNGTPALQLEVGRPEGPATALYTTGSGTDTLTFRYTVRQDDWSLDLDYPSPFSLSANGAFIRDSHARNLPLTLPLPGAVGSLSWNKDLVLHELPFVNGMPIDWLTENFPGSDPGSIQPDDDPDGDGMGNYDEYIAGTDPNDPDSLLRMRSVSSSTNGFVVTWQATPSLPYRLEYRDAMNAGAWTNPPAWGALESGFDSMSVTDGTGLTPWPVNKRYYRVIVAP